MDTYKYICVCGLRHFWKYLSNTDVLSFQNKLKIIFILIFKRTLILDAICRIEKSFSDDMILAFNYCGGDNL